MLLPSTPWHLRAYMGVGCRPRSLLPVAFPLGLVMALPAGAVAQRIDELTLAPGSGPAGLAVGSDENIWFADETGKRIGRVSPCCVGAGMSAPTEYPLPNPGTLPHGVTGAPKPEYGRRPIP